MQANKDSIQNDSAQMDILSLEPQIRATKHISQQHGVKKMICLVLTEGGEANEAGRRKVAGLRSQVRIRV